MVRSSLISHTNIRVRGLVLYRDGLKGGPVLLTNSQARPVRYFSQPRARLMVHLCTSLE